MGRFLASRPAPSDASAISVLLAKDELRAVDEKRERLKRIIADVAPRRSSTVETELKRLTRERVQLLSNIARATR